MNAGYGLMDWGNWPIALPAVTVQWGGRIRVRFASFPAVQSRDRRTLWRGDGEIRRICDERAIVAARIGATGAIASERNTSISGDAYMREKNLFMVNLRGDGLQTRRSRGFLERDAPTVAEACNGSAASFHSTCVSKDEEHANLDIRGRAFSISPRDRKPSVLAPPPNGNPLADRWCSLLLNLSWRR